MLVTRKIGNSTTRDIVWIEESRILGVLVQEVGRSGVIVKVEFHESRTSLVKTAMQLGFDEYSFDGLEKWNYGFRFDG